AMALSGAFDCFEGIHRAQFFHVHDDNMSLIEKAIRYGNAWQQEQLTPQVSLFGDAGSNDIATPKIPNSEPWSDLEKLKKEKDIVGFYISGHPLDLFKLEIDNFCTCSLDKVMDYKDREVQIGGIITNIKNGQAKNGNNYIIFTLEDYNGSLEI